MLGPASARAAATTSMHARSPAISAATSRASPRSSPRTCPAPAASRCSTISITRRRATARRFATFARENRLRAAARPHRRHAVRRGPPQLDRQHLERGRGLRPDAEQRDCELGRHAQQAFKIGASGSGADSDIFPIVLRNLFGSADEIGGRLSGRRRDGAGDGAPRDRRTLRLVVDEPDQPRQGALRRGRHRGHAADRAGQARGPAGRAPWSPIWSTIRASSPPSS